MRLLVNHLCTPCPSVYAEAPVSCFHLCPDLISYWAAGICPDSQPCLFSLTLSSLNFGQCDHGAVAGT